MRTAVLAMLIIGLFLVNVALVAAQETVNETFGQAFSLIKQGKFITLLIVMILVGGGSIFGLNMKYGKSWFRGPVAVVFGIFIGFLSLVVSVSLVKESGTPIRVAWWLVWLAYVIGVSLHFKGGKDKTTFTAAFAGAYLLLGPTLAPFSSILSGAVLNQNVSLWPLTGSFNTNWIGWHLVIAAAMASSSELVKQYQKKAEDAKDKNKKAKDEKSDLQKLADDMKKENEKLREDIKAIANAQGMARNAQGMVAANPAAAAPIVINVGNALPREYLPNEAVVDPRINMVDEYNSALEELKTFENALKMIDEQFSETLPGKEAIYLAKVKSELEDDLKTGNPAHWLAYAGEKREKAVHADEVEKIGAIRSKFYSNAFRQIVKKVEHNKEAMEETIALINRRLRELARAKEKIKKDISVAIEARKKRFEKHIAKYREHDEKMKQLNALLESFNSSTNKHNKDLYDAHQAAADAQSADSVEKLKAAIDDLNKKIASMQEEQQKILAARTQVESAAKEGVKVLDGVQVENMDWRTTLTAEDLQRDWLGNPPPEGGKIVPPGAGTAAVVRR